MNRSRTFEKTDIEEKTDIVIRIAKSIERKTDTSFVELGQSCLKGSTVCPRRHIGYKIRDPRDDIPLRQPGSATRAPTSI